MPSNNRLLRTGVKVEKAKQAKAIDPELGWPKRLYHNDNRTGEVFQTKSEQEKAFKLGWVESPAGFKGKEKTREELLDEREKALDKREKELEEKEKPVFGSLLSDKKSKSDLSDKKTKKGEK